MSDLAFHIRHFVPDAEGADLEHRITLLKARDFAAGLRGNTVSRRAYDYACDAHEIAGDFVFSKAPPQHLEVAVGCCRHLVMAATLIEQLDEEGGA